MMKKQIFLSLSLIFIFSCQGAAVRMAHTPPGRSLSSYEATGSQAMVASANEAASQAGIDILKKGGNAVDAAVAVSFALSVVQPHHTGVGGGGFALIRMARDGQFHALDFRETAPRAAQPNMYIEQGSYNPLLSKIGGHAVAVPGLVKGLLEMERRFGSGKIPLPELLAPAIRLAEDGFPVTREVANALAKVKDDLAQDKEARAIFLPNGRVLKKGERLFQKELAKTLRRIAQDGETVFYRGEIARAIVEKVHHEGGILNLQDLSSYQVRWRTPVQGTYRGYTLYSMPPPSSGGVHLIEILNILENYPLATRTAQSEEAIHWITEAERRAYADRAKFLGDPDFIPVPVERLTSKEYARGLRGKISDKATPSLTPSPPSTTHFSIVDAEGNVVASTQTINLYFGSGRVVRGVILNNEMDDFSAQPGVPNAFGLVGGKANEIRPGKRPLSSMTPTIVLDPRGNFFLAVGAAGGSRIITSVLQTILNLIDFRLSPIESVAAARTHHQWLPDEIQYERNALPSKTRKGLKQRGHVMKEVEVLSRVYVHAIVKWNGRLVGISDPREEGKPVGF